MLDMYQSHKRHKLSDDTDSIEGMIWATRKEFTEFMMLGPLGSQSGYHLRVDSTPQFKGGRRARIFCRNCKEFFVVATCLKDSKGFVVTSHNLSHETMFEDGSFGSCTGSLEVPVGARAVAANPVFNSIMQMEQNHFHSGRVSTSTLQKVLGSLPTPLQA